MRRKKPTRVAPLVSAKAVLRDAAIAYAGAEWRDVNAQLEGPRVRATKKRQRVAADVAHQQAAIEFVAELVRARPGNAIGYAGSTLDAIADKIAALKPPGEGG